MRQVGKIGVYGTKTRALQRRLSFEAFGLTFKQANVFLYQGNSEEVNPEINDIQFSSFSETVDRSYADTAISIPVGMDRFSESTMDFSRFGIIAPMGDEHKFRFHVDDFIPLGRKIIVGDIFELPFYTTDEYQSMWEVTDVDDKLEAEKFITTVTAVPMSQNRKTAEISVMGGDDNPLDDLMGNFDQQQSDEVMVKIPVYGEPEAVEEIDNRDEQQSSFLDDPNNVF